MSDKTQKSNSGIGLAKNDCDVLFGGGQRSNKHPGNIYFRTCLRTYYLSFNNNDAANKAAIKQVKDRGGRFLKLENDSWTEVQNEKEMIGRARTSLNRIKQKLLSEGLIEKRDIPSWMTMYTCLQNYKKQHGDCLVPRPFKGDNTLGKESQRLAQWVSWQRQDKKNMELNHKERIELLDKIGFVWVCDRKAGTTSKPSGKAGTSIKTGKASAPPKKYDNDNANQRAKKKDEKKLSKKKPYPRKKA